MQSATEVEISQISTKHTLNPVHTDVNWNLVTSFNEEKTLYSKTYHMLLFTLEMMKKIASEKPFYVL